MTKISPSATGSSVLMPEARRKIIRMIQERALGSLKFADWDPEKWSEADLNASLNSYSDTVNIALREFLWTEPRGLLESEERDDLFLSLALKEEKISEELLHDYLTYFEYLRESGTLQTKIEILKGLSAYSQLPSMENYSQVDEETKAKVIALLTSTSTMNRHSLTRNLLNFMNKDIAKNSLPVNTEHSGDREYIRITDDNIVSLLLERPEEAEKIAELVVSRNLSDGVLIRQILNSEAPSVREGML